MRNVEFLNGCGIGEKADVSRYHIANTFYGSGVMFSDIDYGAVGVDEEPWQVFNCKEDGDVKSYIICLTQGARQLFLWKVIHIVLKKSRSDDEEINKWQTIEETN